LAALIQINVFIYNDTNFFSMNSCAYCFYIKTFLSYLDEHASPKHSRKLISSHDISTADPFETHDLRDLPLDTDKSGAADPDVGPIDPPALAAENVS
jgi:hypothetical protein